MKPKPFKPEPLLRLREDHHHVRPPRPVPQGPQRGGARQRSPRHRRRLPLRRLRGRGARGQPPPRMRDLGHRVDRAVVAAGEPDRTPQPHLGRGTGINIGAATVQRFLVSNNSILTVRADGTPGTAGVVVKANSEVALENNLVTGSAPTVALREPHRPDRRLGGPDQHLAHHRDLRPPLLLERDGDDARAVPDRVLPEHLDRRGSEAEVDLADRAGLRTGPVHAGEGLRRGEPCVGPAHPGLRRGGGSLLRRRARARRARAAHAVTS